MYLSIYLSIFIFNSIGSAAKKAAPGFHLLRLLCLAIVRIGGGAL